MIRKSGELENEERKRQLCNSVLGHSCLFLSSFFQLTTFSYHHGMDDHDPTTCSYHHHRHRRHRHHRRHHHHHHRHHHRHHRHRDGKLVQGSVIRLDCLWDSQSVPQQQHTHHRRTSNC